MRTKNIVTVTSLALVLALSTFMLENEAHAGGRKWDFPQSHGMANCSFAAFPGSGTSVNPVVTSAGNKAVSVDVEEGSTVTLRLSCAYPQTWDPSARQYTVGKEVDYSSSIGGSGTPIGSIAPLEPGVAAPAGYSDVALSRQWNVSAPALGSTASYTLTGGSDTLTVTLVPVAKAATTADLAPIEAKADEALEATGGGHGKRAFAIYGGYQHDLDSIDQEYDDRRAANAGFYAYINPTRGDAFRLTLGLDFAAKFRQKPIAAAPNAQEFNQYVDSKTWTLMPTFGLSLMPAEWVEFSLGVGLGLMVMEDGTVPLSQLQQSGSLYTGASESAAAFAYQVRGGVHFMIPVAKSFSIGPGVEVAAVGNFTKLPEARGGEVAPCTEDTLPSTRNGVCLRQRQGWFVDVPIVVGLKGNFNLF